MNAPAQPIHFHRPIGELVQSDKVHTSLYTDPAIFDDEMEKVFRNTWVWVAHVSEVPDVGSYKPHWVGKEPVIVVRDRKKQVRVLLNRCRHRAATVCEHKKGKANTFVCPYHGWSYALDGSLRGVPHPESYGDILDKAEYPLVNLRVEEYAGMVFATFKDDIEPLVDHLGPAKKWMDLFMKQGGSFRSRSAASIASRFRATGRSSWKTPPTPTTSPWCIAHFFTPWTSRPKRCSTLWVARAMSKTWAMGTA